MKPQGYEYDGTGMDEAQGSLWLPPRDAWLIDPHKDKLDTTTDDRGLVIVPDLIQAVKETIDPTYEWSSTGPNDRHHLYWPETAYSRWNSPLGIGDPATFRNLPIHIALVPRVFHNWLHTITRPPELPGAEIMALRVESWRVARGLFIAARKVYAHERLAYKRRENIANNAIQLRDDCEGEDAIGEEYIQDVFAKNFTSWEYQYERNEKLPEEFRVHGIEDARPAELAKPLGKLVGPRALYLVPTIAA